MFVVDPGVVVLLPLLPELPELPHAASTKAMVAATTSAPRARGEVRTGKSFRRLSAGVYQEVAAASRRDTERGRRVPPYASRVRAANTSSLISTSRTTSVTPAPTSS